MKSNHTSHGLVLAAALLLPTLEGCASEEVTDSVADADAEQTPQPLPYLLWGGGAPLMRWVHAGPYITICITGNAVGNLAQRQNEIRAAFNLWIAGIQQASTVALTIAPQFSCAESHWSVRYWAAQDAGNPQWPAISGGGNTEIFPTGDHRPHVLLHEFGHLFGLADTYDEMASATAGMIVCPGQPDSVMCEISQSTVLMADDIAGVRDVYCRMYPQFCKPLASPGTPTGSAKPTRPSGGIGIGGVTRNDGSGR